MKYRTKITALAAVAAFLTITLVLGMTTSLGGNIRSMEEPLLGFLKTGNLDRIVLVSKGEERILKRSGASDWEFMMKGKPFPAASEKVKRLLEILADGKLVEIVTDKEENWKTFGVGNDGEKRLVLAGDQGKAELFVGDSAKLGTREYVRVAGDKRVFVLSNGLSHYAEQKASYWCDLRIFPKGLKGKQIVAIAVKGVTAKSEPAERLEYRLIREKEGEGPLRWIFPGRASVKVKQSAAEGLANALAQASGNEFVPEPEKEDSGIGMPELTVDFTTQDQKTFRLLFGKKTREKQWCCTGSVDGNPLPFTYLVDESAYGRIALSEKNLLDADKAEAPKKKP